MALSRQARDPYPWERPFWPDRTPDLGRSWVGYNPLADELVVRFPGQEDRPEVVSPIETPEADYADVLIDEETGEVIGVQVDLLRHVAVRYHPDWLRLAEPDPPPEAVASLVAEVRGLFERYWIPAPE